MWYWTVAYLYLQGVVSPCLNYWEQTTWPVLAWPIDISVSGSSHHKVSLKRPCFIRGVTPRPALSPPRIPNPHHFLDFFPARCCNTSSTCVYLCIPPLTLQKYYFRSSTFAFSFWVYLLSLKGYNENTTATPVHIFFRNISELELTTWNYNPKKHAKVKNKR